MGPVMQQHVPVRALFTWPSILTGALVVWCVWERVDIAVALVVLGGPFTLVERWRPLRRQCPAFRRAGAATDAVSFLVNEVVTGLALVAVLVVTAPVLRRGVPAPIAHALSGHPGWARWVEAFVVSEVCGYWGHRLSHEIPVLWRFHRVHHSAPELDWLAPSRRHPLDALIARTSTALPLLVLGFGVPTVATHFALKRIQGLLVHANIDVRLGPLERVVATPFFHHWHHSADPDTWNTNYAGSVPAVDWLFGTLHLPDRWPQTHGATARCPTRATSLGCGPRGVAVHRRPHRHRRSTHRGTLGSRRRPIGWRRGRADAVESGPRLARHSRVDFGGEACPDGTDVTDFVGLMTRWSSPSLSVVAVAAVRTS